MAKNQHRIFNGLVYIKNKRKNFVNIENLSLAFNLGEDEIVTELKELQKSGKIKLFPQERRDSHKVIIYNFEIG